MTRQELLDLRVWIDTEATNKISDKGDDYSGREDTLQNLKKHGPIGVLARIGDKECRINRLVSNLVNSGETGQRVSDSLIDDIIDMRNYSDLLIAVLQDSGYQTGYSDTRVEDGSERTVSDGRQEVQHRETSSPARVVGRKEKDSSVDTIDPVKDRVSDQYNKKEQSGPQIVTGVQTTRDVL